MLSRQIQKIAPSATAGMRAKINALENQGVEVSVFTAGEPDFRTPEHIVAAAKEALDKGYTKYAAYPGLLELRKAIIYRLKEDYQLTYDVNQIQVTTGAKQALYCALLSLIDDGDEVIIPTPCWVSYPEQVKLVGGVPVFVPMSSENNYSLDLHAIEQAITNKTKVIIINNPNNPCGTVYSEKELGGLAVIAQKKDLFIIADEIYDKLIYDDEAEFVSVPTLSEDTYKRTVLINGCSKAYAMTGWRIGYAAGPSEIIKGLNTSLGHITSGANTIAQHAAIAAFSGPQDEVETMRQEFKSRGLYMCERLNAMPGIRCAQAKGAFYLLPDVSSYFGKVINGVEITDAQVFCDCLLTFGHVATVSGVAFQAPNAIRFSYATSMQVIKRGMDKMEAFLKSF